MKKLFIILYLFAAHLLAGQNIYTVYDRADEAKFEIYDPISPERLQHITDSLLFSFDASTATGGCKWVQDFSLNGGHSDCRIREIVIAKNPPNRRMVISKGCDDCITFHTYSDTVNYCPGDLNGYEVEQFERRGYVMVDTCGLRLKWPTGVDSIAILSSNATPHWQSMKYTGIHSLYGNSIDTIKNTDTKLDTITIRVLCEVGRTKCGYCDPLPPVMKSIQVERTLEWQTWNGMPSRSNGWFHAVNYPKSGWREISRQYLDSIEGCYQLVPLKE